jgi:hypothetical protein
MSTDPERRAYGKLRDIIERCGGSMTYRRQGYRYGAWKISLNGKTEIFKSTGKRRLPALDRLYAPNVRNPKTWYDYSDELVPDAERQLLSFVLARSEMTKQRWRSVGEIYSDNGIDRDRLPTQRYSRASRQKPSFIHVGVTERCAIVRWNWQRISARHVR